MKWIVLAVVIPCAPTALAQVKTPRGTGEPRVQYQPRVAHNPA